MWNGRGADLVAEARHHADRRHEDDLGHVPLGVRQREDPLRDLRQQERARQAVEPAHPVEHDPRRDAAEDDVLERGLAALAVVDLEARHHERDHADDLDREVNHEQAPAHRHQVHPDGDDEEQRDELGGTPPVLLGVMPGVAGLRRGDGADEHHRRDEPEERAEEVRVAVEGELAPEEGQRRKVVRQIEDAESERARKRPERDDDHPRDDGHEGTVSGFDQGPF